MAYNRRSGGNGYGGFNSGGGGGRFNGGGYRGGSSSNVNPWQSNSSSGGPMPRQSQQGGPTPALAMASNIITKLLTSSTSMTGGSGYSGGPNRSGNWNSGGPRMSHMSMRQRHDGSGYSKDNRRRGGDSHNRFSGGGRKSGGGTKDGEKRKSSGKVNDENKKGPNERERTKEQLDSDKKASYVGVPSAVLYCHVCSKHMWDSESFEKHVRGRPHELMMTYLDEAYRMRVDFMRHQIKAVENQREIDLERVTNNKHKANSNKNTSGSANASKPLLRSYCPMCDVRFYGPLTGHRKSDRHRKLKQFLHPECKLCDALFHTRLEMDEHKLTAGHLKKVAEQRNLENPHLKDDEFDLIDMIKIEEDDQDQDQMPVAKKYEMLTDRDATKLKLELEGGSSEKHREKKDHSAVESDSVLVSDDKTIEIDEGKEEEKYDDKDGEQYDEKMDEDNETSGVVSTAEELTGDDGADQSLKDDSTINVDLTINKDNQAAYDPDVAIGQDLLIASNGYVCRLCNCFLLDEQRVSIHCQTAAHYINYTTMTKMKEATSGGKKRSIDQVTGTEEAETNMEDVNNGIEENDETVYDVDGEDVVSQEAETDSEQHVAKRIKLDVDEIKKESDKMDTGEQPKSEIEPVNVVIADNIKEEPVEIAQPVAVVAAQPAAVPAVKPVAVPAAQSVVSAPQPAAVPAAQPVPVAAAKPVVATAKPVAIAKSVAASPVVSPNRGRGGGRGRGHRGGGGGVARRGNRR